MSVSQIVWILATSLILGLVLAMVYKYKTLHTKEFVITLTLMPALIAIIINYIALTKLSAYMWEHGDVTKDKSHTARKTKVTSRCSDVL